MNEIRPDPGPPGQGSPEQVSPEQKPRRSGVDPEDIRKALEQQARNRPPRGPAKEMPITPPLPRIPKLRHRRRHP